MRITYRVYLHDISKKNKETKKEKHKTKKKERKKTVYLVIFVRLSSEER